MATVRSSSESDRARTSRTKRRRESDMVVEEVILLPDFDLDLLDLLDLDLLVDLDFDLDFESGDGDTGWVLVGDTTATGACSILPDEAAFDDDLRLDPNTIFVYCSV